MGSSCCKKSDTKESEKTGESVTPPPPSGNKPHVNVETKSPKDIQNVLKADDDSNSEDSKKVIEDDKLEKELKNAIKGGESAYGRVKPKKNKGKKKELSPSNYNAGGLVDKKSKEFNTIRDYFLKRNGINYQLIESIGSGNYAEVYKALSPERNRFFAIKAIELTENNENYRKNFLLKEMEIISKLKHPSIVKHYEMGQTHNKLYMIMEYCANGSITDWLRDKGAFSESTAWELDIRIIDGLNHMHSMSMAHRDLKLENILLTDKMHPKISDFSYSVIVDEKETQSTTFCGSLPYFAPEILQRKPHNPLPSDVWALGVCFYVMVCDGLPFKINDEKQMLNKQLERDWDFKKRVQNKLSNDFKQIIHKMLEPDVAKRATTQQLINDQWFKSPPKPLET